MAMMKCAECGTEISNKAAACVKCGAPTKTGVVTTQQTGKKYKGLQIVGALLLISGFVAMIVNASSSGAEPPGAAAVGVPVLMIIAGIALWIGGRFFAWWRHG